MFISRVDKRVGWFLGQGLEWRTYFVYVISTQVIVLFVFVFYLVFTWYFLSILSEDDACCLAALIIDVLRPLLCTKSAERPPKVMKSKMKHPSDMPTLRFEHGW